MKTVKEKMIVENRDISFDIFRSLIITSAIVLHFNNRFTLGVFAYPFRFIDSHLFNVGNFFFFTAGYMGYLNYYKNNKRNIQYDSIKSIKKGFYILFVYCSFVTFMRVLTNTNIPNNFFDFFWNHRFYAKVLVTFSFVYIMSPVILKIFKVNKIVSIILFIIVYLVYVQNYSM
ncbi:uncharacterized protein Dvar_71520 [Desulfosarcina variabilis str. Montpellier]|uniref:hypothetical protein n=1 Tax=Desulfosarcina variabilis TaxID=2300 RepID=UPI003AFB30FB